VLTFIVKYIGAMSVVRCLTIFVVIQTVVITFLLFKEVTDAGSPFYPQRRSCPQCPVHSSVKPKGKVSYPTQQEFQESLSKRRKKRMKRKAEWQDRMEKAQAIVDEQKAKKEAAKDFKRKCTMNNRRPVDPLVKDLTIIIQQQTVDYTK